MVGQDRLRNPLLLDNLKAGVALQPGHEPDALVVVMIKPGMVQVVPVKDQQVAGFELKTLDGPAVMGQAVGDEDALGQKPR